MVGTDFITSSVENIPSDIRAEEAAQRLQGSTERRVSNRSTDVVHKNTNCMRKL